MYDVKLQLKDAGAVTSSGYGEVDGQAAVLNVGEGLIKARLVVDVSAIEVDDSDELYQLHLMGGDDESFTETVSLVALELGAAGALEDDVDSETGRYEIPVTNKKGDTIYPYLRIRHAISGTVTTGINYTARLEEM